VGYLSTRSLVDREPGRGETCRAPQAATRGVETDRLARFLTSLELAVPEELGVPVCEPVALTLDVCRAHRGQIGEVVSRWSTPHGFQQQCRNKALPAGGANGGTGAHNSKHSVATACLLCGSTEHAAAPVGKALMSAGPGHRALERAAQGVSRSHLRRGLRC
jgi:hypothetical protein